MVHLMINSIIIHCSDTPTERDVTAEDIHGWHLDNGWDGIGYHYVIRIDGAMEKGRPDYWVGSHVAGHNTGSLGICLIGCGEYTPEQWYSLKRLVNELKSIHKEAKVLGHNELSSKTCPNFNVQQWLLDEETVR